MSVYTTLSAVDIANSLDRDTNASWSWSACIALGEYYEALSEDMGEDIEFDAVAIRCEWSQYESIEEALENYSDHETIEDLENETIVIVLDNGGILVMVY